MSGRPKTYDDAAVINAAMDVFWTHGYEASSTDELCRRTGLGRGSLYHAFGSKQALYERALQRYQELGLEKQVSVLTGPGSAKQRLRALLQWGMDSDLDSAQRRSCMALFSALERSCKDPIVDQINRAYVSRLEAVVRDVIAEGQRNHELRAVCPLVETARAFLASYYGLRILGQSMPDRAFLQDVLEGIIASL